MGDEQSESATNAFDYAELEDKKRSLLKHHTAEIKIRVRRSAQDVIDIGKHLARAKKLLGHGQFLAWVETEFGWGYSTSLRFMQTSQKFKNTKLTDLEIAPSALYILSAPSIDKEVRRKAIEIAQQGEPVSHATAKRLITEALDFEDDDGQDAASYPLASPEVNRAKSNRLKPLHSSASPEHYTPKRVLDAALECFGGTIDLDPCSNSRETPNVPANRYYFEHDDGLAQDWIADTLFMNPPYGRQIDQWVSKLVTAYTERKISTAIALVPARTDTQWFAQLNHYPVCFVRGRLTFVGNDDPAPFPSAVFYLGPSLQSFYHSFAHLGEIWQRLEPWMFADSSIKLEPQLYYGTPI